MVLENRNVTARQVKIGFHARIERDGESALGIVDGIPLRLVVFILRCITGRGERHRGERRENHQSHEQSQHRCFELCEFFHYLTSL